MKKTLKEENPCWDGYEMVGMKMKDGKEVPNCVPKNESVNEINLKSVGVKEFLNQLLKNQSLIKKLGFRNMRDVLAYIQGGGIDDWMELKADGRQLGMNVNEANSIGFEIGDFVHFKSKNKTGMVKKIVGDKVTILTMKGDFTGDMKDIQVLYQDNVNERLDKTHLGILKYAYKDIDKINPSDPAYARLVAHLDKMSKDELKQIAGADIKFLSLLAKNRLMRNEDHSSDPNDKYVVKPCDEPGQPWAVWEGPIRVKGFASQEEAQAYADAQNKEQGLTEGNAFTGALYQARKEGKSEFEFNGKTYPVQEAKDETLEEGIKMKKLHEGSFSEIDIMAREARNFNEFVKEFYKDYKDFPKDKETIKWLKSLYDGRSRDESVNEGYSTEEKRIVLMAVKKIAKYMNVDIKTAMTYVLGAAGELERDIQKGKVKESVNEGISPKDMDIIKSAVTSSTSFMNIGAALKKTGLRYIFATSPMPIYVVQDKSGNRVAIVNKKYASKPDFVHGDTAVGVMESKSINEADVVGKTVFSDGKGKLHFGYYKTDDAVEFVDYKTWKKLSFKDVSKGDTNKDKVIASILRNQKQFNKKVDYNMWAKKTNPSFEEKMDWFIQNGWISNINKGGIKESVNEASIDVDTYRKKQDFVIGRKFAQVASDSDVELMARLKRANSEHAWQLKQNIASMDHLYKKYKIQSSKGVEK